LATISEGAPGLIVGPRDVAVEIRRNDAVPSEENPVTGDGALIDGMGMTGEGDFRGTETPFGILWMQTFSA
jgi:hypothetical protein